MTYLELEIAVLQKMFAIDGNTLVEDDSTNPYLAGIPQAANEAMDLLAQAGEPLRKCHVIHQVGELPDIQTGGETYCVIRDGVYRYDFSDPDIVSDFEAFDASNFFYTDTDGNDSRLTNYDIEAGHILILDAALEGDFRIWYKAQPTAFSISSATAGSTVIPLSAAACNLLPLYIASQLYKDDDISMAAIWRNEFEAALSVLSQRAKENSSGRDEFRSVTGWW